MKFEKEMKELKRLLVCAEDFREIWDYYMTNFGENEVFRGLGKQVKKKRMKSLITLVGQKLLRKDQIIVSELVVIGLKKFKFEHGICLINGGFGNFFYFDNLDMGLISFIRDWKTSEVSLARLTGIPNGPSSVGNNSEIIIPPVSKRLQ